MHMRFWDLRFRRRRKLRALLTLWPVHPQLNSSLVESTTWPTIPTNITFDRARVKSDPRLLAACVTSIYKAKATPPRKIPRHNHTQLHKYSSSTHCVYSTGLAVERVDGQVFFFFFFF